MLTLFAVLYFTVGLLFAAAFTGRYKVGPTAALLIWLFWPVVYAANHFKRVVR